jgi:hypothetical protein
MVSQGMSDTKFSELPTEPTTTSEEEKPDVEKVETKLNQSNQPEDETDVAIPAASVSTTVRRKRKEQSENFRENYFRRVDFYDRQLLYITRATHERLTKIVNLIGGRRATISSYVENILQQHVESNREEINRLLDEYYLKNKNDF